MSVFRCACEYIVYELDDLYVSKSVHLWGSNVTVALFWTRLTPALNLCLLGKSAVRTHCQDQPNPNPQILFSFSFYIYQAGQRVCLYVYPLYVVVRTQVI